MFDSISFDTYYLLAETSNSESYTKAVVAALMVTAGLISLISLGIVPNFKQNRRGRKNSKLGSKGFFMTAIF